MQTVFCRGRTKLSYNPDSCFLCGLCSGVCNQDAIIYFAYTLEFKSSLCNLCGRCVAACPTGALKWMKG